MLKPHQPGAGLRKTSHSWQLLTTAMLLTLTTSTLATENGTGIYLLGSRGPLAGYLPEPGFYVQNDLYIYSGDTGSDKTFPTGGRILANVESEAQLNLLSGLSVLDQTLLGGHLAVGAVIPFGNAKVDAEVQLDPANFAPFNFNLEDSTTATGDPLVTGSLGWHAGDFHWSTSALINVPVGEYRENEIANISINRWAADFSAAVTWLSAKTGTEASLAVGYTVNGTNQATNYHSGDETHLEWSLSQFLSPRFSLGLTGYHYQQVSKDRGEGARLGPYKGRVTAVGGTLGYNFQVGDTTVTSRLKVFEEFDAENRMEATTGYLTLGMPL